MKPSERITELSGAFWQKYIKPDNTVSGADVALAKVDALIAYLDEQHEAGLALDRVVKEVRDDARNDHQTAERYTAADVTVQNAVSHDASQASQASVVWRCVIFKDGEVLRRGPDFARFPLPLAPDGCDEPNDATKREAVEAFLKEINGEA